MQENINFISAQPKFCLGCNNCVLACATKQDGTARISIVQYEELKIPSYCRHCDEAFCLEICPVDAIKRVDGVVLLDEIKCTGCQFCVQACPYGVITISEVVSETGTGQIAKKCDLCYDKQLKGGQPACFIACPTKALQLKSS